MLSLGNPSQHSMNPEVGIFPLENTFMHFGDRK